MSDLLPIPALPPAPPAPQRRPSRWWRLTHPRTARQARLLAAHHAWTTERARQAQIDLVRAGYHLGPVPYGYFAVRVLPPYGVQRRRVRLVIDPVPASIVAAIYRWRVDDRLSARAITTRLRGIEDLALTPVDTATGFPRPWTPAAVTRVLTNPVYTGATVWGRTVAGRPVPPEGWIICPHAHEPIIDGQTFHQAQQLAAPGTGVFSPLLPPWRFPGSQSAFDFDIRSDGQGLVP